MSQEKLYKYPRTHHIEGSRLQPGDEDLNAVAFQEIRGKFLVVEEKVDGANCAVSFDSDGNLLLQSRGHYLTGGWREKHFSIFKQWSNHHATKFHEVLQNRYIMYGEWLYAKHTMFYNQLPHYFMEFDIFDKQSQQFLSTKRRQKLLSSLPVVSVRVLHEGSVKTKKELTSFVGPSAFLSKDHIQALSKIANQKKLETSRLIQETDSSTLMEGLYIKVEEDGIVKERYKFIRPDFLTSVLQAQGHWLNKPIFPNLLEPDINIYE